MNKRQCASKHIQLSILTFTRKTTVAPAVKKSLCPFKALASVYLTLFLAIAAFTVEETLPPRRCKPDIMWKCDCTFCIDIRSHLRVSGQIGHTDSVNTLCLKYQVSLQPCTCRVHNSNYVSWVTSSSIKHRNEVSNITSNFFCIQVNTGTLDHPFCL